MFFTRINKHTDYRMTTVDETWDLSNLKFWYVRLKVITIRSHTIISTSLLRNENEMLQLDYNCTLFKNQILVATMCCTWECLYWKPCSKICIILLKNLACNALQRIASIYLMEKRKMMHFASQYIWFDWNLNRYHWNARMRNHESSWKFQHIRSKNIPVWLAHVLTISMDNNNFSVTAKPDFPLKRHSMTPNCGQYACAFMVSATWHDIKLYTEYYIYII